MSSDYIDIAAEWVPAGQRSYAGAAQTIVGHVRPQLVDVLDDRAFLEPLVFACIPAIGAGVGEGWLDRVLAPYLPHAGNGVRTLDGTAIELRPGGHPLLTPLYGAAPRFDGLADTYAPALERAVLILGELVPRYAELIHAVTRAVVLHEGPAPNSFASPSAHGAVFLNMALGDDEVFLVEDLVHQCGHVLFSAASRTPVAWLTIDPATGLGELTGDARDPRSIYVALHGVFTEAAMVDTLDRWLQTDTLEPRRQHELTGRLAFALRRFGADLQLLARPGIFGADGQRLIAAIVDVYRDVASRRRALTALDFSNQDYNFDYARFAARNPG